MTIGPRIGPAIGPRIGPAIGVSSDPISAGAGGSLALVTRDAASGKYTPASAAEWAQVMAVAGIASGGPSFLWLCQEASGNLADSIDTGPATVSGTPINYQQAVAGWTRLAVTGGDAGTGLADSSSASLPDPSTQATLVLSYAIITATPAAIRQIDVIGTANVATVRVNTTPRLQMVSGGSVITGTSDPTGAVRPFVLLDDPTGSRSVGYSDQEKLTATRAATTGKRSRMAFDFAGGFLYRAEFAGSAAQLNDAQVKTLLQTLGWTIPWS
jgi:hypothetical protein